MAELLRRADFKYIDPNWDPFEYLLQIAKFEEEKSQINHDHGQSLCKQENMGLKRSFTFNNNSGKKTKRSFKEEDGDGEWESGLKPKLKRSKRQRFTFNNNAGKKNKPEFEEEDGDAEWESGLKPKLKRSKKQRLAFNDNAGKKTKPSFKEEDADADADGEWKSGLKLPKLKRSKKHKPPCPIPTPDLPERFKRHISENMGGSGLVLVIEKALFYSDVNPTASRLSIPLSQVKTHHFLEKTEADKLDHKNPMQVCLLDPSMEKTTVTLNRWEMGKTSLYVMTESWNSVVKKNRLKKGDIVQLWSFRVDSNLCFALVRV